MRDGRTFVVHTFKTPVRDEAGNVVGILGIHWEVTEERLVEASNRMAQLIDDLLKPSRATRAELRRQTVDLSELARTICEELRMRESGRDVDVVITSALVAHGDPTLLRSVLVNLLDSAWKFTSKRPRPRIEFGSQEIDGERTFYVRDNGAGFDMAYAAKLFQTFQRLHRADEFGGTGVGLATVGRIIRSHGGRVWAHGGVDEGATFSFTLQVSKRARRPQARRRRRSWRRPVRTAAGRNDLRSRRSGADPGRGAIVAWRLCQRFMSARCFSSSASLECVGTSRPACAYR